MEYIQALRIGTDLVRNTTIVSIYQAGESLYQTFDKVCLIYEGRMVYFGPTNLARQYFIDMGYVPANRQTTPDFLVSVTDPKGRRTAAQASREEEVEGGSKDRSESSSGASGSSDSSRTVTVIPKTALDFEEYYRASDIRQMNLDDMNDYKAETVDRTEGIDEYKASVRQEQARHVRRAVSILSLWMPHSY